MKLCTDLQDPTQMVTPWGPIKLEQRGKDSFRVTYGLQVKDHLTYAQAATELGSAIMHWLACEGDLDNRMRER